MLYRKIDIGHSTRLGIWKITETADELSSLLAHDEWLGDVLAVKSEAKRTEKLAVRVLLKELAGEEKQIKYCPSGKPFLPDNSYQISISHTRGYAAVILDRQNSVGIDIEQITEKVKRVRVKFVSERECIDLDNELIHLLLHWSAKEAVYKLLEMPDIDLKEEVTIEGFIPCDEGIMKATECRRNCLLEIYYEVEPDFVLAYLIGQG